MGSVCSKFQLFVTYGSLTKFSARATSAAPTYFSPFFHKATKQTYLDGGLWHNNPIKIASAESKAIWPDNEQPHPDVLLSIGTGYHKSESTATDGAESFHGHILAEIPLDVSESTWCPDSKSYLSFLMSLVHSQFETGLSSQRIWHEWLETRAPDSESERRYRRLDVEFENLVKMDDTSEVGKNECRKAVKRIDDSEIQSIADQLLASCFFFHFDEEQIERYSHGGYKCSGRVFAFTLSSVLAQLRGSTGIIECRLRPESTKLLGELLERQCEPSFQPHFLIKETHEDNIEKIPINKSDINRMKALKRDESFHLGIDVSISGELVETEILLVLHADRQTLKDVFHISGLPRKLQKDYTGNYGPRIFWTLLFVLGRTRLILSSFKVDFTRHSGVLDRFYTFIAELRDTAGFRPRPLKRTHEAHSIVPS